MPELVTVNSLVAPVVAPVVAAAPAVFVGVVLALPLVVVVPGSTGSVAMGSCISMFAAGGASGASLSCIMKM